MFGVLKHDKKEYKIKSVKETDTFSFQPKNSNIKINIYDEDIRNNVIDTKFNNKYKKLLEATLNIDSDEDDSNESAIVLSEIDKFRNYILNNYSKYISEKTLNKYLKMLNVLDAEIERKIKERIDNRGKSR